MENEIRGSVRPGENVALIGAYGSEFWQNLNSARDYHPDELENTGFPYRKDLKPLLKRAAGVRFVEYNGGSDWRYVIDSQYDRPDGPGKYKVRAVYGREEEGWRQEATLINLGEPTFALVDRVQNAVYDTTEDTIRQYLGQIFLDAYTLQNPIEGSQRKKLPDWKTLKRLVPRGATVRYLEGVRADNPLYAFPGEEGALGSFLSLEAVDAYKEAKKEGKYNFKWSEMSGRKSPEGLPGIKIIEGSGKWRERDDFYFLTWKDQEGAERFAYVTPQHTEKSGFDFHFLEVYTPKFGEGSEPGDFSISYLYYKPEGTPRDLVIDHAYITETKNDRNRFIQILRPLGVGGKADNTLGDFENVLLAAEDLTTGKTLNFSKIYPEARIVSTRKKPGYYASVGHPVTPVMHIKRWGANSPQLIGHETTHLARHHKAMEKGVEESVRLIWESNPFYSTYIASIFALSMVADITNRSSEFFRKNPYLTWGVWGAYVLSFNTLLGDKPYRHIVGEERAENGGRLFIQAAREAGVDLVRGIPDQQLKILPDSALWNTTKVAVKVVTAPRLPIKVSH